MPDLPRDFRRTLEATVKAAREAAELGAAGALRQLGVFDSRRPGHPTFTDARNEIRLRLRAHAKSLGDRLDAPDGTPLRRLVEAAAYVQWHRLLFARFLVERKLLRDETGVAISLTDCREEAATGGAEDEWSIAAAHAARMLPGVFPSDDPLEALVLAREHTKALRDHLRGLDRAIFAADDSLGWTYQFWRAAEKKAVNDSQVKIGAGELPAVTQLFTEPYMVRFLLHNTLGAWWAGKMLAARPELTQNAADEASLRAAAALPGCEWDYLRFVRQDEVWRPAAGVFPGWPVRAADLTVLDPCCGSGHFLTEALAALSALRVAEEALSPADAVIAVLRDNLAGLEIDGRCVQIAAFALALTAWRIGGVGTKLPTPHVAWVGAPPPLPKSEFSALANGDADLQRGLVALHDLFASAPLLGSLIEVTGGDLVGATRVAWIEESITALVERMRGAEPERAEGALAARGMADAAAILTRRWVLQTTNVPFLGRGRQDSALAGYLGKRFNVAKADLATAMLERMRSLAAKGGTVAAVTPQNWFFLSSYAAFRRSVLTEMTIDFTIALGEEAWESFGQRGPLTTLSSFTDLRPSENSSHAALDLTGVPERSDKILRCLSGQLLSIAQATQLANPDARIVYQQNASGSHLSLYADSYQGICSGDYPRFGRYFWEIDLSDRAWVPQQNSPNETCNFDGLDSAFLWENGSGRFFHFLNERLGDQHGAWVRGLEGWGSCGVMLNQMRSLSASIYTGVAFDNNSAIIIPKHADDLPAIFAFCASKEFSTSVRRLDPSIKVTNLTLLKVPFDLARWHEIATERYPNGLPEPNSDDPTQWLFHGHPRYAEAGTELHVTLARLAGYRWPAETDVEMRLSAEARAHIAEAAAMPKADGDGLLTLLPVLGERALADRLRAYCTAVWGDAWQAGTEATLIATACERAKDKPPRQLTLDAWLRAHAARQHAKLFRDRPFLWWITDGRVDGFCAVAHYHRLTRANFERLAWTVLGDWITRLGDDPRAEAARVLQTKLARILVGESPFDIFVRWKKLEQQPLGWELDLDDGVRLNIRPFIEANVLAHEPNVKYGVDRGKDVSSAPWFSAFDGERRNDHHTTLAEKRAARAAKP